MSPPDLLHHLTETKIAEPAAVAWVHSGALLAHAHHVGMLPARAQDVRAGLEQLAERYPQLQALADPAVNPAMGTSLPASLAEVCAAQAPPLDSQHREMGHALGDLYQDLSAEARKQRALCQTPHWVTELLLELAWDPAYEAWGVATRAMDPACGTGHILTEILLHAWVTMRMGLCRSSRDDSPRLGLPAVKAMSHVLGSVAGVDLDPYAAALARYRLLAVAVGLLRAEKVRDPAAVVREMAVGVAAANSLLDEDPLLGRGQYHCVIANPPYITPKDATMRDAIRAAWPQVCHRKYALSVPFEPLMHELCVEGGFVARLTANSFMKREFGTKLIEEYFPTIDLTWVIDTSGAYIPGHGTPTVILVSRNQPPSGAKVSTVRGVQGEPRVPEDPARGLVWSAIAEAVQQRLAYQRFERELAQAQGGVAAPRPVDRVRRGLGGVQPVMEPLFTVEECGGAA